MSENTKNKINWLMFIRLPIFPFAVVFELFWLAVAWLALGISILFNKISTVITYYGQKLPSFKWYLGKPLRPLSNEINQEAKNEVKKFVMSEHLQQEYNTILTWINSSPVTISLLYDLGLMPEQVKEGSRKWGEMCMIAEHMRAAYIEGKASKPE